MKRKKITILSLLLLLSVCLSMANTEKTKAATSYNNAKVFYESTGQNGYHTDIYGGDIYFATSAKLASVGSNTKYKQLGYDIALSGNGQTVSFAVKSGAGGSMVNISCVEHNGYQYNLFKMSCSDIIKLAQKRNAGVAGEVFKSSIITVRLDAIMTTVTNGNPAGGISEDGNGIVNKWGNIYHLKNDSDWETMKKIFYGHDFKSYRKIYEDMENYTLSVSYKLNGGSVAAGYSVKDDILYLNGKPVTSTAKLMQQVTLPDFETIHLTKTGYHTEKGKEWMEEAKGGKFFSACGKYVAKEIAPEVGIGNVNKYLYANWKPNTYTIKYEANGGKGDMSGSSMVYDVKANLSKNGYTREGYTFTGWNTKEDGTGTFYRDGQKVSNLTTVHQGVVNLYAQWEAIWVDESEPQVELKADINTWTNRDISLSAVAYDEGLGLSSLAIYIGDDMVAEKSDLKGAQEAVLDIVNTKEGAVTYKAVAVDMNGNIMETFKTVYYDIVAPKGKVTKEVYDGSNLEIMVDVTDF